MKTYDYTAKKPAPDCAISDWSFESFVRCRTSVLPDGCRDIIIREHKASDATWFVSDLSHSAYSVSTLAGVRMRGLRLKPGVRILETEFCSWMKGRDPITVFEADQLCEFCLVADNLTDALSCLSSNKHTVPCVARELGVSVRTLERLVKNGTGQTPYFWLSLGRIRRVGRAVIHCDSLVDVAMEAGFSDQAHMNREIMRWFKLTPSQIRTDPEIHHLLFEPGYS